MGKLCPAGLQVSQCSERCIPQYNLVLWGGGSKTAHRTKETYLTQSAPLAEFENKIHFFDLLNTEKDILGLQIEWEPRQVEIS